ncbi:PREDICTED: glycerol-3-phosphate acyltransferase 1-like [Tarenaya hassleriana]|uniref:glycerol-3-phosphate acyltransferase 1-like n=1 Tax=Tarenaya hassleriana TaxID=28532 RepID=UPI00053C82FA|nr:PREDICTED: glycerol-3-phosphate acyltransferase 1-like [Tarenaya hassleriana]
MVFPMVLGKLAEWFLYHLLANSCYKAARKLRSLLSFSKSSPFQQTHHDNHFQISPPTLFPSITKLEIRNWVPDKTLVCDIDGVLLRQSSSRYFHSFFPYFMLVAFEGGSIIRAFLLLLSCSFLWFLDDDQKLRVLSFITFAGFRVKDMDYVARAVLPKFYLENLNRQVYDIWVEAGSRVVFTSLPKVMVEGFLREYMNADDVTGTKLQEIEIMGRRFYTGLASGSGFVVKHKAAVEYFSDKKKKPELGIGNSSSLQDHLFISICKEACVWSDEEDDAKNSSKPLPFPRERYPKPLIFHDGRLAFVPTPLATLSMYLWLPFGIFLAIFRILVGILLPYEACHALVYLSGLVTTFNAQNLGSDWNKSGVLYVCNHRTLLDPVFLSGNLGKPLTAVTYSLSKFSEAISPIKTVRLRRDREKDGEKMRKLLSRGDLVVCPEGTTCREPYLLRFSPLFAELAEDIVPVAVNTHVSMFYGTTASGLKWLDPIFFLMNPNPHYFLEVLEKLPREMTCSGEGRSSLEVANLIQREIARVLGFECTNLTRKDKYMILAGNEGTVK